MFDDLNITNAIKCLIEPLKINHEFSEVYNEEVENNALLLAEIIDSLIDELIGVRNDIYINSNTETKDETVKEIEDRLREWGDGLSDIGSWFEPDEDN